MKKELEGSIMNELESENKLNQLLKEAISMLKNDKLEEAYKYILDACKADPNAPQPHNLLGIWYEFRGKSELARKHYRVAYVLDPTFKPASENLERVSTLFPYKNIPINYGEIVAEDMNLQGKIQHKSNTKV